MEAREADHFIASMKDTWYGTPGWVPFTIFSFNADFHILISDLIPRFKTTRFPPNVAKINFLAYGEFGPQKMIHFSIFFGSEQLEVWPPALKATKTELVCFSL